MLTQMKIFTGPQVCLFFHKSRGDATMPFNHNNTIFNFDNDFRMVFLFEGPFGTGHFYTTVLNLYAYAVRDSDRFSTYPRQCFFLFFYLHSLITRQNKVVLHLHLLAKLVVRP